MAKTDRRTASIRVRARATAVGLALVALTAGCTAGAEVTPPTPGDSPVDAQQDRELPRVVATTAILGDIVVALGGDDVRVDVLMPPGTDPHDFQLSAAAAASLRDADLIVMNGLGLEEALTATLDTVRGEGITVLSIAEDLDPLPYTGGHDDTHDDHADDDHADDDHKDDDHKDDDHKDDDHEHGALDPHVWWDAERMARGIRAIADALTVLDGGDAAAIDARTTDYLAELEAIDAELAATFAAVPSERRRLVTNHDALGYLAARYDLEVIGTIVPGASTQAAVDAASFAALVEAIERAGVRVVFAEGTDSRTLADQLASEVIGRGDLDVEVVTLYTDTLGPPGSGTDTYLGLLRTTAITIAQALAR
jgi:zinc/manganese transport system substrate-binding protein